MVVEEDPFPPIASIKTFVANNLRVSWMQKRLEDFKQYLTYMDILVAKRPTAREARRKEVHPYHSTKNLKH